MSLLRSFGYALNGFKVALLEQRNMKIHLVASGLVIFLGFYFHVTSFDWIVLIILMSLVISMELLNSALESLSDLVTKEHHPIAGKVKDMAASAVLVVSIASAITGIIIFLKYV